MKFNLCLIRPEGNVHVAAFDEVIDVLGAALVSLGHEVVRSINGFQPDARNIVFGFFYLDQSLAPRLPKNTLLFNTEQLVRDDSPMVRAASWWCQQGFEVWDYSPAGVEYLKGLGARVKLFRLGFHPVLARIAPATSQDIDVLFYGSVNDRRRRIIDALKQRGLHVFLAFGAYGKPRDALIARARVVLNMHHYDSKIFEVVRCFYLMANAKAIVSEVGADTLMDEAYLPGLMATPYDSLVDACVELVADAAKREALERRALHTLRLIDQKEAVRKLLEEQAPQSS